MGSRVCLCMPFLNARAILIMRLMEVHRLTRRGHCDCGRLEVTTSICECGCVSVCFSVRKLIVCCGVSISGLVDKKTNFTEEENSE